MQGASGQEAEPSPRAGDRRGPGRRGRERRRDDRRAPLPLWRRPLAYAAYGVAAALLLMLAFRGFGAPDAAEEPVAVIPAPPPPPDVDPASPAPSAAASPGVAGPGEYERLLARGDEAVGERVRAVLFCAGITSTSLRDVARVNRSVAELADASGRVPAAECQWGAASRGPTVLVLVPPDLATQFAAAPEVEQGFVRRRRVAAEVEWVGRSEALALRTAVVLRAVGP
jgi:hypothetical protein